MRLPVLVVIASSLIIAACGSKHSEPTTNSAASAPAAITELQRIDIEVPNGEGVSQGQVAVVHYTGWLYDAHAADHKGKKFDSSRDHGQPFRFEIGAGNVIKGWDEGVQGMRVGGQRRLIIPASLAYGSEGAGDGVIPPNSPLVFDIELLAIEQPK
jgi:FKBP-type peptidyl-prolyl cis-trans isomerase FkpA